jgi:hypothetical protein
MAKLMHPYSLTLSDPEKFVGRNNACLEGVMFVQLEEMIIGRNENYDSRLKHYVTSETLDVEEKYKASWPIENHLFITMTANKKSVVRITEHSRRFAVYDVPDRFRGNQSKREEYFGRLWAELEAGGLEALAHELMQVDLDGFSPAVVPRPRCSSNWQAWTRTATPCGTGGASCSKRASLRETPGTTSPGRRRTRRIGFISTIRDGARPMVLGRNTRCSPRPSGPRA